MGMLSMGYWAVALGYMLVIGVPVARLLERLGFSRWWTLVAFVPVLNIAGLWVLAGARWRPNPAPYGRLPK